MDTNIPTMFSTNTHTHLGNSFTLMAQAEVVKGKWWGIFVWGTCSGLKNGFSHALALEVDNVYGHFRDKNCVVRFSEWDNDFCNSCKKISANIFHRFGTRDRFNEFGVGAKCKLFYAPNMFVSVDVFPQCN